eukprot:m51a1_g7848 putative beta- n-acetylgalactosaminyltransferase 2 (277) ;mRNA; r:221252-222211
MSLLALLLCALAAAAAPEEDAAAACAGGACGVAAGPLAARVTFVVKTMDRPDCVDRLVRSLRAAYPDVRVLVADDGARLQARTEQLVRGLPGPVEVRTPLLVLLDDDFVFEERTDVAALVAVLEARPELDIASGGLRTDANPFYDYAGRLEVTPDGSLALRYGDYGAVPGPEGRAARCRYVDIVANFFAARTERVRGLRWDDELKLGEHQDFFLRAKRAGLRVAACAGVVVYHAQVHTDPDYKRLRMREPMFLRRALAKNGLRRLVIFSGLTYVQV